MHKQKTKETNKTQSLEENSSSRDFPKEIYQEIYIEKNVETNSVDPLALFHFFTGKNIAVFLLIMVFCVLLYGNRVEYHQGYRVDYGKNQVVSGEHRLYFSYSGGTLRLYATDLDRKNQSENVMVYQQWLNGSLRQSVQGEFVPQTAVPYGEIASSFFVSKSPFPTLTQMLGRAYFYFLIPGIFFLFAPRLLAFFFAPFMANGRRAINGYKGFENCKYEETWMDKYTVYVGLIFLFIALLLYARYRLYGY